MNTNIWVDFQICISVPLKATEITCLLKASLFQKSLGLEIEAIVAKVTLNDLKF